MSFRRLPTDVIALTRMPIKPAHTHAHARTHTVFLGLGSAYYSWKPIIEQVERERLDQKQRSCEIDHEELDKKIKERQAQMQAAQAYEEMLRARAAGNNDSDSRS